MLNIKDHLTGILATNNPNRSLAIDVFRGIAITGMILVNNPGSWSHVYAPLKHAEWHGWTPTDVIFPFFIVIVGISISLSLGNRSSKKAEHHVVIWDAMLRAFKLFLLGLFLAAFYYDFQIPNYDWWQERIIEIRIPGVLQRISIVYLACMLLALYCRTRVLALLSITALLLHTGMMLFIPYSDGQTVYLGVLDFGNSYAAYIDSKVFSSTYLYYDKAKPFAFDPEGIVSTLPTIVSGLVGVIIGRWWLQNHTVNKRILVMLSVGISLTLGGLLIDVFYPINKALWTASFVLLTSGLACLLLAALVFMLDKKRWQIWSAPLIVFGANSLLFFMFAGIVARLTLILPVGNQSLKSWLYTRCYQPLFGDELGSLVYALIFMMASYIVFYILYKQRLFWKV